MLDFDKGEIVPSDYLGAEKKVAILYEGVRYMVKLPQPIENKEMRRFSGEASYKNNQFSEYIGTNIFKICGFRTQEAVLGYLTDDTGKRKVVVVCKDFTQDGSKFYEISAIKNTIIHDRALKENIEDVYEIIYGFSKIVDKSNIIDAFGIFLLLMY